jgi:hypothetical protein
VRALTSRSASSYTVAGEEITVPPKIPEPTKKLVQEIALNGYLVRREVKGYRQKGTRIVFSAPGEIWSVPAPYMKWLFANQAVTLWPGLDGETNLHFTRIGYAILLHLIKFRSLPTIKQMLAAEIREAPK